MKLKEALQVFEQEDPMKLADEVVVALSDIGVDTEVLKGGENFNVSFSVGDETYYIRPNDEGNEDFYMSADKDDSHQMKLKDINHLVKHTKELLDK